MNEEPFFEPIWAYDNDNSTYDVQAFECDEIGDSDIGSIPRTNRWNDGSRPIFVDPGQKIFNFGYINQFIPT